MKTKFKIGDKVYYPDYYKSTSGLGTIVALCDGTIDIIWDGHSAVHCGYTGNSLRLVMSPDQIFKEMLK